MKLLSSKWSGYDLVLVELFLHLLKPGTDPHPRRRLPQRLDHAATMQAQWRLVDQSRPKRSNEEEIGVSSKRQRRIQSQPESPDKCEDVPQIRGGLARPRPPELGPPPNRAKVPASQASKTDPAARQTAQTANTPAPPKTAPPKTAPTEPRIVDSDEDDDEEDWRSQAKLPAITNQPGTTGGVVNPKGTSTTTVPPPGLTGTQGTTKPPIQPPKVSQNEKPLPPMQEQPQLPTPPNKDSSNRKQGTNTSAGTGTGGPGGTSSTTAPTVPTVPTGPLPPYPQESEILELYRKLQEMVVIWVEECLPDTFPGEFKDNRPERYWELCGWCQPLKLGNAMLANRSWAKYVYESWVWRFLYSEIFQPGSLAWAGNDRPTNEGGAAGAGKKTNDNFSKDLDASWRSEYRDVARTELTLFDCRKSLRPSSRFHDCHPVPEPHKEQGRCDGSGAQGTCHADSVQRRHEVPCHRDACCLPSLLLRHVQAYRPAPEYRGTHQRYAFLDRESPRA